MKKSRFTETQIVRILKEVESGRLVKEVCREYGVSEASDIKRLKELEDENRRLKQMYADLCLDNRILKDIVEKSSNGRRAARIGGLCSQRA